MAKLPIEILTKIFTYLDYESLQKNAALVCKDWFEIIRSNSKLSGRLVLHLPMQRPSIDLILKAAEIDGPGRQSCHFDAFQSASSGKEPINLAKLEILLCSYAGIQMSRIPLFPIVY